MKKRTSKLLSHVVWRVLPLAALSLLGIWGLVAVIGEYALNKERTARLEKAANDQGVIVQQRLNTILYVLRDLAANQLIVNGLIDVQTRHKYLPAFFRSLHIPNTSNALIAMTDYRGKTIVTNNNTELDKSGDWLKQAMKGQETFHLSKTLLKIAIPIRYHGLPEGILVLQQDIQEVSGILSPTTGNGLITIGDSNGRILYSSDGTNTLGDETKTNAKFSVAGFSDVVLWSQIKEDTGSTTSALLHIFLLVAFTLDLIALAIGIFMAAYLVTRPLSGLVSQIRRFKTTDGLSAHIDPSGPDEIRCLANVINETTDSLHIEIQERRRREDEQLQKARLESLGTLASGIAHEINTPLQFVGDNIEFFQDHLEEMSVAIRRYQEMQKQLSESEGKWENSLPVYDENNNLNFLLKELPEAMEHSIEGVDHVKKIVDSMKQFSHPGSDAKEWTDINQAIESTVTVCRNEWKYIADLKMDLQEIPEVYCRINQLNQVWLNMIVNASHAIKECEREELGDILIATRHEGDFVYITIFDNGAGIPSHIVEKIYDPFFTTKGVGVGTGQGLAISYDIIVNKHGGEINLSSTPGEGTSFIITIPVGEKDIEAA